MGLNLKDEYGVGVEKGEWDRDCEDRISVTGLFTGSRKNVLQDEFLLFFSCTVHYRTLSFRDTAQGRPIFTLSWFSKE